MRVTEKDEPALPAVWGRLWAHSLCFSLCGFDLANWCYEKADAVESLVNVSAWERRARVRAPALLPDLFSLRPWKWIQHIMSFLSNKVASFSIALSCLQPLFSSKTKQIILLEISRLSLQRQAVFSESLIKLSVWGSSVWSDCPHTYPALIQAITSSWLPTVCQVLSPEIKLCIK